MASIPNRRSWWMTGPGLLLAAAIATSGLAWWLIAFPVASLTSSPSRHTGHNELVYVHMLGGTLMLFLGAANIYIGTTRRFFRWHKPLGYTYLTGGLIGAGTALLLTLGGVHTGEKSLFFDLSRIGGINTALAALSTAWLISASIAWTSARNRKFVEHRAWMIRSYVLTWSFVLCRLLGKLPAIQALGDNPLPIWLSWLVPLFLCELGLRWKSRRA